MTGAVWTALNFRMAVLNKMNYALYFDMASNKETTKPSGGWGFGMIRTADSQPWFPYYVVKMFGNNLKVGDSVLSSQASSDLVRTLAWKHNGALNLLLICKSAEPLTVNTGLEGGTTYLKIEDLTGTDYDTNRQLKTGVLDSSGVVTLNGYTVMLIQTPEKQANTLIAFFVVGLSIIGLFMLKGNRKKKH
jgi:hypothetical protein